MLGVSYPYLLSVETGQRDMSEPLARKLTWLFGLSNDIRSKKASPTAWDPIQKGRVPFSLDTFRKHSLQLPTFRIPDNTAAIEDQVTPTSKDYSKAFHAMLESAKSTGRLGPLLENFFALFREYASSDAAIDAFMASYRRLYPRGKRDAQRALIADVY